MTDGVLSQLPTCTEVNITGVCNSMAKLCSSVRPVGLSATHKSKKIISKHHFLKQRSQKNYAALSSTVWTFSLLLSTNIVRGNCQFPFCHGFFCGHTISWNCSGLKDISSFGELSELWELCCLCLSSDIWTALMWVKNLLFFQWSLRIDKEMFFFFFFANQDLIKYTGITMRITE